MMPRVNYNDPDVEDFYEDSRDGITVMPIWSSYPFLYTQPNQHSKKKCIVHSDIEVDILDETEHWYKIRLPKTFGVVGFILKIYVDEVQ